MREDQLANGDKGNIQAAESQPEQISNKLLHARILYLDCTYQFTQYIHSGSSRAQ